MMISNGFKIAFKTPIINQCRGVIVLHRPRRTLPPNENENHKNLKIKAMRIYEITRNTELAKRAPVKLILTRLVEGLGDVGDVIEAKPKRALFDLLLLGKAEYATPEALKRIESDPNYGKDRRRFSTPYVPKTIRYFASNVFKIYMSPTEEWTMESWHVEAILRSYGLKVPLESIIMPDQPIISSPDVFGKDVVVTIIVNGVDEMRCRLRITSPDELLHPVMTSDSEKPWHLSDPIPLFEDQTEIIEEMQEAVVRADEQERARKRRGPVGQKPKPRRF